jgi:two-component system alkaline phosphatase synthesis response regulator PhoP/two-component system response regulator VicR
MGQTILVVDDDPHVLRLVEINLKQIGCEVRTAPDGEEALLQITASRPDLVILDVMMPRLDGFETLKRLRSDSTYDDLPVIMLTARSQDEDVFEGYGRGAQWYLTKPFAPDELRSTVRRLLKPDQDEEVRR